MFIKRGWIAAAALAAGLLLGATPAAASISLDFRAGFNPDDDTHVLLHVTTGHFRPSERDLTRTAAVLTRPEEMAVVFFIARHSGADVDRILARRSRGASWYSILVELGARPDVLYVGVPESAGPPYGKAHGHKKRFKTRSSRSPVSDEDFVELVQLQITAAYFQVDGMAVIGARQSGEAYAKIDGELFRSRKPVPRVRGNVRPEPPVIYRADSPPAEHGKGKAKGNKH